MSDIEKFEEILGEIPTLKAPGVSGSRIKQLTELAVKNVKEESKLIPILYSACKSVPSSHKLGSMYIVDSIVRAYVDEAKRFDETISSEAPQGSFAAGVYKISELIESLMDDALELSIVKSQTIKILKLLDIWERAQTFDPQILENIRSKHLKSTTPPGTPPPGRVGTKPSNSTSASTGSTSAPAKPEDSNSILLALASLAQKSNSNSSTPNNQSASPVTQDSNKTNNILAQLSAISGGANVASNAAPATAPASNHQQPNTNVLDMLQQMQNQPQSLGQDLRDNFRNDSSLYSRRNRSRSPRRDDYSGLYSRRERSPPRYNQPASLPQIPNRNGPNQFQNNYQAPNQFQNNFQAPNQFPGAPQPPFQNNFQQRNSPGQNFAQPNKSPQEENVPGNPHYRPRNMGFDQSLPQGSIKVLLRTLFLGGVPRHMGEYEIGEALRPYGEVQSVVLNTERKHAFVKVYSRREAEQVITSFNKENNLTVRARWGVGFGPRDCCNYQQGVSIIPMQRLTDADKHWIVKAQWGGTGGEPLQSGMVVDEPDIEIGSGISSKAMSRKMPTNSARNGPKSNRPGEPDDRYAQATMFNSHPNGRPDFNSNAPNPLQGLFNNSPNPGLPANPMMNQSGLPANPNTGLPPMPNFNNMNQNQNNLGNQLSNFFNQQR